MIPYLAAIATLVGIRALLTFGLNVQWGLTGLVNLGIVAFFAVGAYTTGLLTVAGVAFPLAWAAAIVLAAVAGDRDGDGEPAGCARTIWPSSPWDSPRSCVCSSSTRPGSPAAPMASPGSRGPCTPCSAATTICST